MELQSSLIILRREYLNAMQGALLFLRKIRTGSLLESSASRIACFHILIKTGSFCFESRMSRMSHREIPVFVFVNKTQENELLTGDFRLSPSELMVNMSTNSNTTRIIYIYNK